MKEARGDILTIACDAVCITTNGYVTDAGNAVMGRGIAKQFADAVPGVKERLGRCILVGGNHVHKLYNMDGVNVLSFPVKPATVHYAHNQSIVSHAIGKYKLGSVVPGFHAKADLELIECSAHELLKMANKHPNWKDIHLPRPGCGAGELSWDIVGPALHGILDDRFTAFTF